MDGVTPASVHPIMVSNQFTDESLRILAVFHDIFEDTKITEGILYSNGFSEGMIFRIKLLSKDKNMDYLDYIRLVASDSSTRLIKIADIEHNTSTMPDDPKYDDRRNKYKRALEILNK